MLTIIGIKYIIDKEKKEKDGINMKYDIIIIGAGPAGITAAIYALRANKKVLIIEKEVIGGKIASAPLIENYPGIKEIKGAELSETLYEQVLQLGGEILLQEVVQIKAENNNKVVITKDKSYETLAVIIATGTKYKTLEIEKESDFIGKGISFCATCDGFFYKNKIVAVIGGGNSAIANALELANICQKVYVIQILENLTGEPILIKRLKEKNNIEVRYHAAVKELIGKEKLEGIKIQEKDKSVTLSVDGVFLSIGQIPETNIAKDIIQTSKENYIKVNQEMMTNKEGVFSAGDCNNKKVRQLTTAINDGTIAALSAIAYIENFKK